MQLFYIHGFNSFKGSSTPKALERAVGITIHELYYHSNWKFDDIMSSLTDQYLSFSNGTPSMIIGTSMGGFFADQLSDQKNVFAVILINPVVDPVKVLSMDTFMGEQENFITHEKYIFSKVIANTYATRRDMRTVQIRRFLMLSEHDELLDSNISINYWGNCSRIVNIEGGHRLKDYGSVARIILSLIPEDEFENDRYAG